MATTPMVVWVCRNPGTRRPSRRWRAVSTRSRPAGASRAPARRAPVSGSRTSPNALTATSAPTVASPTRRLAVPSPPSHRAREPERLADGGAGARADRPLRNGAARRLARGARPHGAIGPSLPSADGEVVLGSRRRPAAPRPPSWELRRRALRGGPSRPKQASSPRRSRRRAPRRESAARCGWGPGRRGRGAPRRRRALSTAPTAPAGQSTAVHPVRPTRSVAWPTRRPATSVSAPT